MEANRLTKGGLIITIYIVLTVIFGATSYGAIQIRWSAGLYVLSSKDKDLIIPLGLAVGLSNLYGGLGLQDIILGSIITMVTCWVISKFKNDWVILSLIPIVSAPLLSIHLSYIFQLPYSLTFTNIFIGQAIASITIGWLSLKIWGRLNEIL